MVYEAEAEDKLHRRRMACPPHPQRGVTSQRQLAFEHNICSYVCLLARQRRERATFSMVCEYAREDTCYSRNRFIDLPRLYIITGRVTAILRPG